MAAKETHVPGGSPATTRLPVLNAGPVAALSADTVADLRFHMLIKPVGAACNLDCTYCFYLHKEQMFSQPRMPLHERRGA
jgi:uncharacterized radical SAM superfamily Fe-S cluster-containing enzyme